MISSGIHLLTVRTLREEVSILVGLNVRGDKGLLTFLLRHLCTSAFSDFVISGLSIHSRVEGI